MIREMFVYEYQAFSATNVLLQLYTSNVLVSEAYTPKVFFFFFNIEIVGLCNLLKSMDVHISLYIYPFIARQFFRGEVIEDGRAIKLSKNES